MHPSLCSSVNMGEALYLVIGGLKHEHALIFASSSVLLQVFVPYRSYAPILKFLTLVLFLYVAVVFTIEIPWPIAGTFVPRISLNHDYLLLIVAVFGTTISPYLFFWQASQEVEEMRRERSHPRRPMMKVRSPSSADTYSKPPSMSANCQFADMT